MTCSSPDFDPDQYLQEATREQQVYFTLWDLQSLVQIEGADFIVHEIFRQFPKEAEALQREFHKYTPPSKKGVLLGG